MEARRRGRLLDLSRPLQQQSSVKLGSEHNGRWRSLCEELSIFVMKVCDVSLTLCIFFSLSFYCGFCIFFCFGAQISPEL